ncbi:MAG: type II toxin-antitoxin system VapC family toxin [Candidatus Nanohaloarchaea archaeon]
MQRSDPCRGEEEAVEKLLEGLQGTGFGSGAAKRAAEIDVELREEGVRVDVEDVIIAAIALERGETVVTGNPGHFEPVPGLETVTHQETST